MARCAWAWNRSARCGEPVSAVSAVDVDHTHEPGRTSWVQSANGGDTDFPLQNLPLGVAGNGAGELSVAVAIGDYALDLSAATAPACWTRSIRRCCAGPTASTGC